MAAEEDYLVMPGGLGRVDGDSDATGIGKDVGPPLPRGRKTQPGVVFPVEPENHRKGNPACVCRGCC